MATRMQQRRGTAQQWLDADPVLAAGEIGFETDTNEFRIGDGVNTWSDLSPFKNLEDLGGSLDDYVLISTKGQANGVASLNAQGQVPVSQLGLVIDGAPAALDTLNEIAAALADDSSYATTIINALEAKAGLNYTNLHINGTTSVHGIADTAALATKVYADGAVSTHSDDTTSVHGIADTSALATKTYADDAVSTHSTDTTSVHGISNTADLVYTNQLTDFVTSTESNNAIAAALEDYAVSTDVADNLTSAISGHNAETTDVHGISNTANLVYAADLSSHASDTTDVHGIADTAALATKTYADGAVSTHNSDTTDVHGIADTAALATKTYADNSVSTAVGALTKSSVGLANVDNTADADKPVSTAAQTALDLKAPLADPTFTGTVSGVTKAHVGLANVDNTTDANKPVSTATQTALDAKAPIAAPSFTGDANFESNVTIEGNLTVEGTTTTVNTSEVQIDDPLFYLAANQYDTNTRDIGITGAYGTVGGTEENHLHTGLVKDVTDGKWKLFSNAPHPVNNVVDFTSAAYDTLKVGPLEATTVTPSSGVVFSDGTQTKVGVPSITTFGSSFAANGTLAAGEQDKFVPVAGAVTITLPATGYSTGQSIDFYQASGTGAQFSNANSTVGTPGLKFRTTNSVVTAMKTAAGWLVFGDLSL